MTHSYNENTVCHVSSFLHHRALILQARWMISLSDPQKMLKQEVLDLEEDAETDYQTLTSLR